MSCLAFPVCLGMHFKYCRLLLCSIFRLKSPWCVRVGLLTRKEVASAWFFIWNEVRMERRNRRVLRHLLWKDLAKLQSKQCVRKKFESRNRFCWHLWSWFPPLSHLDQGWSVPRLTISQLLQQQIFSWWHSTFACLAMWHSRGQLCSAPFCHHRFRCISLSLQMFDRYPILCFRCLFVTFVCVCNTLFLTPMFFIVPAKLDFCF